MDNKKTYFLSPWQTKCEKRKQNESTGRGGLRKKKKKKGLGGLSKACSPGSAQISNEYSGRKAETWVIGFTY